MAKAKSPVGAHMSISKGFLGAFESALSIGADALQFFTKSPRGAMLREIPDEAAAEVMNWPEREKIRYAVIHSSYLLNLAKPLSSDAFELKSLTEDVRSAAKIGADGTVLHIGKYLKSDIPEAKKLFVENVALALEETKGVDGRIILENTAGQGTEMGYWFADLGELYKLIKKETKEAKRLAICFDTQHAFAAGYDLSTQAGVTKTLEDFDKEIGLKNLACIHFNDSKKICGARVDRHQDIGKGEVGAPGLKAFAKSVAKACNEQKIDPLPLLLETPQEHTPWEDQIKEVRSWL